MDKFLTVGFEFCGKLYRSLIMIKNRGAHKTYQITVMNGDLEKILFCNNLIEEVDGCLQVETAGSNEQLRLKTTIAEALSKLLAMPLRKMTI